MHPKNALGKPGVNGGVSSENRFGGGTVSNPAQDIVVADDNEELINCEDDSLDTASSSRETSGGGAELLVPLSSSGDWDRPVSFWTSAMKSLARVWMTLGECV